MWYPVTQRFTQPTTDDPPAQLNQVYLVNGYFCVLVMLMSNSHIPNILLQGNKNMLLPNERVAPAALALVLRILVHFLFRTP